VDWEDAGCESAGGEREEGVMLGLEVEGLRVG
jgi:hypothetical protein